MINRPFFFIFLYFLLFSLFFISSAAAYVPSNYTDVKLSIADTSYTASNYSNVKLTLGLIGEEINAPPIISFVPPTSNSSNLSQSWIAVNITASDDNITINLNLTLYDSSQNKISSNGSSSSPLYTNFTGLNEGNYYFNASAEDDEGLITSTATRNVMLDITNPAVEFIDNTTNESFTAQNYIEVNVSAIDTNLNWINLTLFNSTYVKINSTSSSSSPYSFNFTGLDEGNYYFNATANDSAGNINSTETRNVLFDFNNPSIEFIDRTVNSSNISESYIEVNVSAIDTNLNWINLTLFNSTYVKINSTSSSSSPYSFNFTGLNEGNYYFNATANDSAGNINSTETRNVMLDFNNPSIEFIRETSNETFLDQNWIFGNISASDTNAVFLINLTLLNLTDKLTSINSSISPLNNNFTLLAEGNFTLLAEIADMAGKTNSTNRTLIIDRTAPDIYFLRPTTNSSELSRDWIFASVNSSDSISLASFNITLFDNNFLKIRSLYNTNASDSINMTNLTGGTYYLNATVNDSSGKINFTETRTITLLIIFTSTICSEMSSIEILPDLNYYNMTSGILTQNGINATNQSLCGYAYNFTAEGDGDLQARLNITLNASYLIRYNDTILNGSWITIYEGIIADLMYYINITGDYINATAESPPFEDEFRVI